MALDLHGWIIGDDVEYALTDYWSVLAEYDHIFSRCVGDHLAGPSICRRVTMRSGEAPSGPLFMCVLLDPAQLQRDFLYKQSSFGSQENTGLCGIRRELLDSNEAQTGTAISGAIADSVKSPRHRSAVNPGGAGIGVDAETFIERNHQKSGHKWQRHS